MNILWFLDSTLAEKLQFGVHFKLSVKTMIVDVLTDSVSH